MKIVKSEIVKHECYYGYSKDVTYYTIEIIIAEHVFCSKYYKYVDDRDRDYKTLCSISKYCNRSVK